MKLLKSIFGCVLALALTACTVRVDHPKALVNPEALKAATVALVHADEETSEVRSFCTGVWVSKSSVLTAFHCVEAEVLFGTGKVAVVVESDVFPPGGYAKYETIIPRVAKVSGVDKDHDLALLRVENPPERHGVTKPVRTPPYVGQPAFNMGHPLGLWWSFASGEVAAIRQLELDTVPMLWVQTTTPTSKGNSGGGLFDAEGDLLGIAHAGWPRGENLSAYIHPIYIEAFLAKHQPL